MSLTPTYKVRTILISLTYFVDYKHECTNRHWHLAFLIFETRNGKYNVII